MNFMNMLAQLYGISYNKSEVIIMLATISNELAIKYTTMLPKTCIDEMKNLTDKKIVPSVSQGIRLAIENFITIQKQHEYTNNLKNAAKDAAFIKRTMDTQNDFSYVDQEGVETW